MWMVTRGKNIYQLIMVTRKRLKLLLFRRLSSKMISSVPRRDVNNATLYAKEYFRMGEHNQTLYLPYRDMPEIIRKYVSGNSVLDYGCGDATKSSKFLKSLGLNVDGVDINEAMVKSCKEFDPKGSYQVINSASILACNEKYDLVFSSYVLMEVSTKSELEKILKEIARVMKPTGTFITIVGNQSSYYNNDWLSIDTQFEENKKLHSGSTVKIMFKDINLAIEDYYWTEEDYHEVMRTAGLHVEKMFNPLGKDEDGIPWTNEKTMPPFTIYVAKKVSIQ